MRFLIVLFAFALNSFAAGPLIFGLRGGVPFQTSDFVSGALSGLSTTRRFEVGPTVGARLPLGFSIEGDALFRRQTLSFGEFAGLNPRIHSDSWEFPMMLKFAPGSGPIAPVAGAGISLRHINRGSLGDIPGFLFNGTTSTNSVGFVAGAGLRFQMGAVTVTPEVRYKRWGGDSFSQSLLNLLPLNRNEASFLVGVTF
jgi:hypothetical protein